MGVRGLKSFIDKNDDLFERQYHLHDTVIVVDGGNLIGALYTASQKHERRDLFGGDMVQFGHYLNTFFNNLRKCNIVPIIVFDGAQTYEENKSKAAEKYRRGLESLQRVVKISRFGFGDFILPATATNVFRSITVDRNLKVVQCMFEADLECARISNEQKSPVLSNDSDFFLMGLNYGVISIDSMQHEQVKCCQISKHSNLNNNNQQRNISSSSSSSSYYYIECSLFKQENFHRYLPRLNLMNLPLLGVLAGNDFIESKIFNKICCQLSVSRFGCLKQFKKNPSHSHDKIVKILQFLCEKTLNETINQICCNVSRESRKNLKQLIRSNLSVYNVPNEDVFQLELSKLYWPGYKLTYKNEFNNDSELIKQQFDLTIDLLYNWLKRGMEQSVLSYRCLEIANNNIIFFNCHLDDPQLPSAHLCQMRPMRVMSTLLRSARTDSDICTIYDRVGYKYMKRTFNALKYLDNFGQLDNYLYYDVVEMLPETRRAILLATFHCSENFFNQLIDDYYLHNYWFNLNYVEEFLMLKLLMDYIDYENNQQVVRMWKHFRQATLLCYLYHIYKDKCKTIDDPMIEEFIINLIDLIRRLKLNKIPIISKKRIYNCRLMHQITQLQSSILMFNVLNAFLGDVMTRIRTENWLNCCIIYNLAEGLHNRTLKLPRMPDIVYNIPRTDWTGQQQQQQ